MTFMSNKSVVNTPQLPLDLSVPATHAREDLVESAANAMAIDMLDNWPDWRGHTCVLAGPVGAGKTHIAMVWAEKADALICNCVDLKTRIDEFVHQATNGRCILIEDAGRGLIDEVCLFHLLNAVRQGGGHCLITSRSWPVEWNVELADLASRLKAVQVFELSEPDDELLAHVMVKLFADRQLSVDEKVIEYCVMRMERSLESAGKLVDAMDAEALSRKSGITRAVAAAALEKLGMR